MDTSVKTLSTGGTVGDQPVHGPARVILTMILLESDAAQSDSTEARNPDSLTMTSSMTLSPTLTLLAKLCISALRCLAMNLVAKVNSGHPDLPVGLAFRAYAVWGCT